MQNKLKMGNKLIIALTEVKKVSLLCICPARSLQGMPSIFDLKKKNSSRDLRANLKPLSLFLF